jgi:transposase
VEVRRVKCRKLGRRLNEDLDELLAGPHATWRYAMQLGRRCTQSTIKAVALEERLDWKTVKDYEKLYMQEKLKLRGEVNPHVIGIDEVSVRKGHTYRIVVSDLETKEPIWFGGKDRSTESMDEFWAWLGPKKAAKIRLCVMDMWGPFEASARKNAPKAAILYDKFHVYKHLGEAMDDVRRSEYARVAGDDRKFIKGQRYNLLSNPENLSPEGKLELKLLLDINKRLNKAYILKEQFDHLWEYSYPGAARKFFDAWKGALKWQKLGPFEKFAAMVDRHWDGIVASYRRENRGIALGYVEGLNNKIRVFQRKAFGLRDEEYLRLKVLSAGLPDFYTW